MISWMLISLVCLLFSFLLSVAAYPLFIKLLLKFNVGGQPIYKEALASHTEKAGTPTMGGILIILVTVIFSLVFYKDGFQVFIVILTLVLFGFMGFVDDHLKLKYKNSRKAMSAKMKMVLQILFATLLIFLINKNQTLGSINVLGNVELNLGFFYYLFAIFIIVGSSNAFNLTDGLDGLAIFPFITNCIFFLIVSIYYHIESKNGSADNFLALTNFYSTIIGASLGFLWFNTKKASIFMGDSGSLALGALLGVSSIILSCEVPFIFSSLIFIIEAASVILQVSFFKVTKGKRIFLIAPIHHHFEKLGVEENKVVVRFWIFSILTKAIAIYMFFNIKGV